MPHNNPSRSGRQRLTAPYKKIERDLCRKIRRGIWQVGSQIPSRQQLARDYDVDISTIQKAVSGLLVDGVVTSDRTRGTYVSRIPTDDDALAPGIEQLGDRERETGDERADYNASRSANGVIPAVSGARMVGVAGRFAPDISELLVPYILAQALENAFSRNQDVKFKFYDSFCDRSRSEPICIGAAKLIADGVGTLCVVHPSQSDIAPIMLAAHRSSCHVVYIPPTRLAEPVAQVYVDHCYDGYQAARFYIDAGHRELTYIGLGEHAWSVQRLAGVRAAVQAAGLPATAVSVYSAPGANSHPKFVHEFQDDLHDWTHQKIAKRELRGAIVAANDDIALEILDVAESEGVKAGHDFSLLGFDDIPAARRRGLTTLRPPLYDIGAEAARLLTTLMEHGEVRGQSLSSSMISQVIVRTTAF